MALNVTAVTMMIRIIIVVMLIVLGFFHAGFFYRETLVSLERAGMKIWVLTGDKKETGVNISYSCGHFSPTMRRYELTDLKASYQLQPEKQTKTSLTADDDNDKHKSVNV